MTSVPIIEDVDPCAALSCDDLAAPIEVCKARGCGFRWQRESIESRKRQQAFDQAEREAQRGHDAKEKG